MESKVYYKSKTIRVAGIYAALGLAIIALPQFDMLIGEAVPTPYMGVVLLVVAAIKAGLRALTDKPVSFKKQ